MRLPLLGVTLASRLAAAEPADTPLAVAVSSPFGWPGASSLGASFYVGLTDHDAVRVNVASYGNLGTAASIGDAVFQGDGDESIRSGRTTDVGFAWTSYSRALWSGFTYELGVLRRAKNIRTDDDNGVPESVATDTTIYAGRAQIGWSWLIGRHVFVATAVGLAMGYEFGRETTIDDLRMPVPVVHDVSRSALSAEGYLRIGVAR